MRRPDRYLDATEPSVGLSSSGEQLFHYCIRFLVGLGGEPFPSCRHFRVPTQEELEPVTDEEPQKGYLLIQQVLVLGESVSLTGLHQR